MHNIWYALQTVSGKEQAVSDALGRLQIESFFPRYQIVKPDVNDNIRTHTCPLFAGYLFSRELHPDDYLRLKKRLSLSVHVRCLDGSVSPLVIDEIKGRMLPSGFVQMNAPFKVGDKVKVRRDEFTSSGTIEAIFNPGVATEERLRILFDASYTFRADVESYRVSLV